jgi:hypothetical protein
MACQRVRVVPGLCTILFLAAPLAAGGQDAASPPPSPPELLRQMSEQLQAATLRFHAEILFDDLLPSGEKIQLAGALDATVKRPHGVYIDYRDDRSAKRFWYDGKTATLLDRAADKYATVELPGEIDAAVQQLQERYDVTLPLGNLVSSDLFEIIEEKATAWGYVGIGDVEGTPCHHLAIVGEDKDLQLWIQRDGKPLLLKFVLTYKQVPMAPQYQAVLMDWDFGKKVSDGTFRASLPKGAEEIPFLVAGSHP